MCLIFAITGASELGIWAKRSVALLWQGELPVHYRGVQYDRGPTESLELHKRKGSRKGPKYPRTTLVGKSGGRGKKSKGRLGLS